MHTLIARYVAMIDEAGDLETLESVHAEMIGHEEHGCATADELRDYCTDYVREMCYCYGIDCADVGIRGAI